MKYAEPKITIIKLDIVDIVTASGTKVGSQTFSSITSNQGFLGFDIFG